MSCLVFVFLWNSTHSLLVKCAQSTQIKIMCAVSFPVRVSCFMFLVPSCCLGKKGLWNKSYFPSLLRRRSNVRLLLISAKAYNFLKGSRMRLSLKKKAERLIQLFLFQIGYTLKNQRVLFIKLIGYNEIQNKCHKHTAEIQQQ